MKKFNNSNQMKAFLKKEAARLNFSFNNVYLTFVSRSFLERVASLQDDSIIVKGSSAEMAYLGRSVRSITDIDIATIGSLDVNFSLINSLFGESDTDNFDFRLRKNCEETKTGIHKIFLEADFGKIKQPLGIDYQDNYNRLIELERRVMPPLFEDDKPFEIYLPSFEEYLAEKMCIILESNKEDVLNTRVKDFYDIYQLHGSLGYDPDKLSDYFAKMLKLRGKIKIEDAKTLMLDNDFARKHNDIWDRTRDRYNFLDSDLTLLEAVFYTRAVLRERLQKNGIEMDDNISRQYVKGKK